MTAEPTDGHESPTQAFDGDQSLANLLEKMARELEERGAVDVDALARSHPEHADRLRQLLPAMQAVAGWAERTTSFSATTRAQADVLQLGEAIQYFGDYVLLEEIARGGMGVVYKARQTTLNRIVALKMILAGELASQREVDRFHAEAQAAAKLDHPGIVPIFEVGQHNGRHYFSMGYVEGTSLAERVSEGPLDPREAAELIRKITQAVAYAHRQGVIHRDLKPGNVLLDERSEPRVTDFGLAKQVRGGSDLTATGQVLGTPAYMPPEQAGGAIERVDERSDVYSIGAMLYCLVTGRPPFQAASPVDTLLQVLSTEAVAPRTLNASVPVDLETICLKCLEKDPSRRYQSADELDAELDRFLNHLPIQARPVGRIERAWRWCKRNRSVAALTAAVASLLIGIAIFGPIMAWRQTVLRREAELNANKAASAAEAESDARKLAEAASVEERQQREKAEDLAEANRAQLVTMNVLQGDNQIDRDDPVSAMPWYVDALRLDRGDAKREASHRVRLATLWRNVPKFTQLMRHNGAVMLLAVSRDEQFLATASDDRTARVWDLTTGQPVTPPLQHDASVSSCAFSSDGKQLITAAGSVGMTGEIRVWEIATAKQVGEPIRLAGASFTYAGFNDAGDIISAEMMMNGEGFIRLRNRADRKVETTKTLNIHSPAEPMIHERWHGPTGRVLEHEGKIGRVIELSGGGRQLCELEHDDQVLSATFSTDGSQVMTTSWFKFYVWDTASGKQLARHLDESDEWDGDAFATARARFSLDNKRITIANTKGHVMIFDVASGQASHLKRISETDVARPNISNDGRFVAVAGRGGAIQVWDVRAQKTVTPPLKHTSAVTCALFTTQNRFLITSCSDGSVRVWDLTTAVEQKGSRLYIEGLGGFDFTADYKEFVILGHNRIQRWNGLKSQRTGEFVDPGPWPHTTTVSGKHELYAGATSGGTVRVWNFVTGKPASPELKHDNKEVHHLRISPDGKMLASIEIKSFQLPDSYFGQANVWRIDSGERILGPIRLDGIMSGVAAVEFSPDSKSLAIGGITLGLTGIQSQIKLFDLESRSEVDQDFEQSPGVAVGHFAFDVESRYLAWVTGNPFWSAISQVRIWDLKERHAVGEPLPFADDPTDMQIDFSSRYVAVATANQVHLLHLKTAKPVAPPLVHDQLVSGIDFKFDGEWITTCSQDNVIRVWDVASGRRLGPSLAHPAEVNQFKIVDGDILITSAADNWMRLWEFKPLDRKIEDIERMVRLLSAQEVSASQITAALSVGKLEADWKHLRSAYPDDFQCSLNQKLTWHDIQTTECWNHGDYLAAIPGYEQMDKLNSCNHYNFGEVLCATGQFERGIKEFDKVIKEDSKHTQAWSHRAIAQLQLGDSHAYKVTCQEMLEQLGNTDNWWASSHIVLTSLIGPNDFADGSKPFELPGRAATENKDPSLAGDVTLAGAIADYRAGRFERAEELYANVIGHSPNWFQQSVASYGLAMTAWKSGKPEQCTPGLMKPKRFMRATGLKTGQELGSGERS